MSKSKQSQLTSELIFYTKLRLGMSLFPVRRTLLNLDREELAMLITDQAENIGEGIKDLVVRHFPE